MTPLTLWLRAQMCPLIIGAVALGGLWYSHSLRAARLDGQRQEHARQIEATHEVNKRIAASTAVTHARLVVAEATAKAGAEIVRDILAAPEPTPSSSAPSTAPAAATPARTAATGCIPDYADATRERINAIDIRRR